MNNALGTDTFIGFIIDTYDYERMLATECSSIDRTRTYAQFIEWNRKCIDELVDAERNFLLQLCNKINTNKISLMDLESCAVFKAHKIYYDRRKNLCIVNPR